ncbi:peptidase M20 domain-containing protein 2-like [Haemaphysalis longicornis]
MASDLKDVVHEVMELNSAELAELSCFLWSHPELALQEMKAHELLTAFLERRGFTVERRYLLDTAFRAEFRAPGGSDGPCIALMCEYDALPDIGHGCGHNLIAEASIGAALAVKEAMTKYKNLRGKVIVLGTPAEESFCGKELLIQKGALNGIDAAIMSHPSPKDVLLVGFSASKQLAVRFKGKTAHAGASPWEGLNALDAAVAAYNNIGLLRQQMKPSSRIHGVITEGGKYPNIIPEATEMRFFVRSPSTEELIEALGKVEACFHGAAEATGCTVTIETMGTYMHVIHNATIAKTYRKHAHSLGVSFVDDFVQNMPPAGASTDCGNVSHRIPTVHPMFGLGDTAAARGPMNHTREFTDWAGAAESQAPTLRAAKIMALTILDLFTDPEILRQAKEEFSALSIPPEEELRTLVS